MTSFHRAGLPCGSIDCWSSPGEIYLSWKGPCWEGILPSYVPCPGTNLTPPHFQSQVLCGLMEERSPSVWRTNIYLLIITHFQTSEDLWIEESTCAQKKTDFPCLVFGFYFKLVSFMFFFFFNNLFGCFPFAPGAWPLWALPIVFHDAWLPFVFIRWRQLGHARRREQGWVKVFVPELPSLPTLCDSPLKVPALSVISLHLALSDPGFPTPLCPHPLEQGGHHWKIPTPCLCLCR